MAAETTTIADLLVGLGVKADPGALDLVERFDKAIKGITSSVRSFSKVADAGAAGFEKLGASAASLAPLITQLGALQDKLSGLKSMGLTKLTVSGPASATVAPTASDVAANAAKKEEAATEKATAAIEKQRAKLETIAASANAVDKATLAFKREQETILQAAAATGDDAAAVKALDAAEQKHVATLAKIEAGEKKAAEQAAKLAEEQQKAAQSGGLFSSGNLAALADGFGSVIGVVEKATTIMLGFAASIAAVGTALAANSLAVAKDALAIERTSEATGLSAEEYQRVAYALERYGVQAEKIPEVLGKMATQATAAKGGSKDAAAAFKQLGISSAAYLKLKPEDQLKALADGFQKISDPSKRAALATKLLGDEMARSLLPLLMQGSDGLDALGDQAEDFGLILSDDTIEESKNLTQIWAELTGIATGLQQQLGARLIPILAELGQKLLNWLTANKGLIDQKFDVVVDNLVVAFDQLSVAATVLDDVFGGLSGFFEFAGKVATATAEVWAFLSAIGLLSSGLPVLVADFTAWALAIQDAYIYLTGGQSVIGALIDQFGQTDTLLGALIRTFQALSAVASAAFNLLSIGFTAAWDAAAPFRDLLASIADIAGGVLLAGVQALTAELTTFLDLLAKGLNGVAGLLGSEPAKAGAQALGASAGTGGVIGAALAPSASSLAATLAPTAPSAGKAGAVTNTITIQGSTVNGSGLDEAALSRVLEQHSATQARQAQAALLGMQV